MRHSSLSGFTLVETLVVITILAVVSTALSGLIVFFYRTNAYVFEQTEAIESARRSVETAMKDIREASYGADGSYPLSAAATSSVTFYANTDSDSSVEKIRYYLSNTTLYRGTTDAAGNPPSYVGQTEQNTLVVANMRNATTSLFSYFDADGVQLSSPVDIADVASVRITVFTDVNPLRAPEIYSLVGSATLRNINYANDF